MSTSYVLIVFALVIVLMIVLISKCKVNAAMGILLSAFILAIALGTPWQDIEGTINSGFSGTIKSVAIVIFLGCTMGTVLEKTGAAIRITKWAIGLVGEKHMIWAIPRLEHLSAQCGLSYASVKINSSQGRWGSCSARKNINLSYYLVLLPSHLIDYVLLHELCHTREMNHGERFWDLLNRFTDGKALALRKELKKYRTEI